MLTRRAFLGGALFAAAALAAAAGHAVAGEPRGLTVTRRRVSPPGWPSAFVE